MLSHLLLLCSVTIPRFLARYPEYVRGLPPDTLVVPATAGRLLLLSLQKMLRDNKALLKPYHDLLTKHIK
jgi:hypothetical protein